MKSIKYMCADCFNLFSLKENANKICPKCGKKLLKRDQLPTIGKFKKIVWSNFSKYIRLRDCIATTGNIEEGVCFTCGKIYGFNKLQAGHMVAKRTNNILFDEDNVKAQCIGCNIYKNGDQGRFVLNRIRELQDDGMSLQDAYNEVLLAFNKPDKELTYEELVELDKHYLIKIEEIEKKFNK